MPRTVEQVLKEQIGSLVFQVAALTVQLETARESAAQAAEKKPLAFPPASTTANTTAQSG